MKKLLVSALCLTAFVALADEETPAEAPAAEAAPVAPAKVEKPKTPSVSLSLKAYPLISKQPNDKSNTSNRGLFSTQTKTQTMQMKWDCTVRIRERVPENLELEVYYIGQNGENKWVQIGETKKDALTLNDKGVWTGELLSPETKWTERKKNKNMRFNNNSSDDLPEKEGERIKGCIVRVLGEGKIWKTFTSDPRWAKVAKKDTFTIDELNPNKSRIGSK